MSYSVLIVDDEPMTRTLLRMTFERAGHKVSEAKDGFEALEKVKETSFDLILLDVMMPGMDGFAVCEQLRQNLATRTLPIIMISARSDHDSINRANNVGANKYLTKPILPSAIMQQVQEVLNLDQDDE